VVSATLLPFRKESNLQRPDLSAGQPRVSVPPNGVSESRNEAPILFPPFALPNVSSISAADLKRMV
jgi:hypothetical protein